MAEDQPSYTRIIQTGDGVAPPPVAAPGEHPALVWRPKLGEEERFDLAERTTRVGRHTENDIVLAGPTVSARHATIRREAIGTVIEDEGSLNGTFVNGELVQQQLLEAGDRVQIGPHLLVYVPRLAHEPELGPRGHRGDVHHGCLIGGHAVRERARALVERDVEHALLQPVIEPGPAKHELAQPVDERLRVQAVEVGRVRGQVGAERRARPRNPAVRGEGDEVVHLARLEVAVVDQLQPGRGGRHALGEVGPREAVAVVEELDREVVAGVVVGRGSFHQVAE